MKKAFESIDKSGDGKLDKNEIKAFLEGMGADASNDKIEALFDAVEGKNSDEKLDFDEFVKGAPLIMPSIRDSFKDAIESL